MGGTIHPLQLIHPGFDDPVTDLIIDLEKLRTKRLTGHFSSYEKSRVCRN